MTLMEREIAERHMAQRCYGYGRWDAPYWFVGPEQGQVREEGGDLEQRIKAWLDRGAPELCDCEEFHRAINVHRFHRDGELQRTWSALMLVLHAFRGLPTDNVTLRQYQRNEWGKADDDGETCVIELSGLAARNLGVPRDRARYRQERINTIRRRIAENGPELVVMYGEVQKRHWEETAGREFPAKNMFVSNGTVFGFMPHPANQYNRLPNDFWIDFGRQLRQLREAQL